MNTADEIRLLQKEISFLDARWQAFKHNLRTLQEGRVTVVINGLASVHSSHMMYLLKRRERAVERLATLSRSASLTL
jgi:hypothetical protein